MSLSAKGGRWLAIATALLLGACTLTILSLGSQSGGRPSGANPGTQEERHSELPQVEPISRMPAELRRNFSLFRSPAKGLPFAFRQRLGSPFGASWTLAQPLRKHVWAVPARKYLCLTEQRPGGDIALGCTQTKQALSHGIFIASLVDPSIKKPGRRRAIIGLAPDCARAVELITPNFRTITVGVRRGVFAHSDNIPASPQTVELNC